MSDYKESKLTNEELKKCLLACKYEEAVEKAKEHECLPELLFQATEVGVLEKIIPSVKGYTSDTILKSTCDLFIQNECNGENDVFIFLSYFPEFARIWIQSLSNVETADTKTQKILKLAKESGKVVAKVAMAFF